jgi:Pectate lyase superfamily protein
MRRRDLSRVLIASAAGSLLQPARAGAGAPTPNVRSSADPLFFGVDPTGTTDSTAALQNWIDASWAMYNTVDAQGLWNGGGGATPVLLLPPGKFRISGTLYLPTGVTFMGTGHPANTTSHTRIVMDSSGIDPARTWSAAAVIPGGGRVVPNPRNGYYYIAGPSGGTTGHLQPLWPATIGAQVKDGAVTWTCSARTSRGDNRNSAILKFRRGSAPGGGRPVNSAVTSTIQHLEFWFVTMENSSFANPLGGNGIGFGDYPDGGTLAFDVDAADFRVIGCCFQHTPAALWARDVGLTPATRPDGFSGNRGIGVFFEECEFDAAAAHVYARNCDFNLFFRHCLFFASPQSYGRCTGKVVYNNCYFEGGAWIDAVSVANAFTEFAVKSCDVEPPNGAQWIGLDHAEIVDISQNTVTTAAKYGGIHIRNALAGSVSDNVLNNQGSGAPAATGYADSAAAIKLINCQNLKVSNNNITATDSASYNGFGILTGSDGGVSRYNFINGNCVTAPYHGANFNGQGRFINLAAGDVRGVNYDRRDSISAGRLGSTRMDGHFAHLRVSLAYSAKVTLDVSEGNDFSVYVTDSNSLTISAPTNGSDGQRISVSILNASGGVMGSVTWTGVKMAAWTSPANGFNRTIDFINWGGTWYEASRTASDVPN